MIDQLPAANAAPLIPKAERRRLGYAAAVALGLAAIALVALGLATVLA